MWQNQRAPKSWAQSTTSYVKTKLISGCAYGDAKWIWMENVSMRIWITCEWSLEPCDIQSPFSECKL
jgi:hypothetical protein